MKYNYIYLGLITDNQTTEDDKQLFQDLKQIYISQIRGTYEQSAVVWHSLTKINKSEWSCTFLGYTHLESATRETEHAQQTNLDQSEPKSLSFKRIAVDIVRTPATRAAADILYGPQTVHSIRPGHCWLRGLS